MICHLGSLPRGLSITKVLFLKFVILRTFRNKLRRITNTPAPSYSLLLNVDPYQWQLAFELPSRIAICLEIQHRSLHFANTAPCLVYALVKLTQVLQS
jgi:hypothetical protein